MGAPNETKVRKMYRMRGSRIPVVSFVGKGSRAALAELNVAVFVENSVGLKGLYRGCPRFAVLSPFKHHGF